MRPALSTIQRVSVIALICLGIGAPSAGAVGNGTHDTTHRMVGVLAANLPGEPDARQYVCSGVLIAPTTFLTAGHCIILLGGVDPSRVSVTFEDQITPDWSAFPPLVTAGSWESVASYAIHPAYRENAIDAYNDVGIVRLVDPVTTVPSAQIADTVGYLNDLQLKDRRFAFVGYGVNQILNRDWQSGPPNVVWDGFRTLGSGTFGALTSYFLRLQTNQAVDPTLSVPGPGDSGAPVFATVDGHDVAVAVVSSGNALTKDQRLDTRAVQSWLQEQLSITRSAAPQR